MSTTETHPVVDTATAPRTHRIVVGVDGSEHAALALDWAARQAGLTGAALDVVTTFGPEYLFVTPVEQEQANEKVLGGARARVAGVSPGAVVTVTSRLGWADQVLVDESAGAELLVVGTRGLGGFRGLTLGSIGRKCVHRATVPVVVVRDRDDIGPDDVGTDHRIVAGIDGSPSSAAALEWAARQATLSGARLEVLMSWEWPAMYGWSPGSSEYNPQQNGDFLLDQAVGPIRARYPDLPMQTEAMEGPAASLLVKASRGADLLAVGSRGHAEFAGLLLGSVSEHCVVHAHCPVLVHHQAA
jgi:nucleotide-binding universal stress UspA family protein